MMYLHFSDVFTLVVGLFAVNTVLILAFRRIVVLEKQALELRRQIKGTK